MSKLGAGNVDRLADNCVAGTELTEQRSQQGPEQASIPAADLAASTATTATATAPATEDAAENNAIIPDSPQATEERMRSLSVVDTKPPEEHLTIRNLDTGEAFVIGKNDPDFDFNTFALSAGTTYLVLRNGEGCVNFI